MIRDGNFMGREITLDGFSRCTVNGGGGPSEGSDCYVTKAIRPGEKIPDQGSGRRRYGHS